MERCRRSEEAGGRAEPEPVDANGEEVLRVMTKQEPIDENTGVTDADRSWLNAVLKHENPDSHSPTPTHSTSVPLSNVMVKQEPIQF